MISTIVMPRVMMMLSIVVVVRLQLYEADTHFLFNTVHSLDNWTVATRLKCITSATIL